MCLRFRMWFISDIISALFKNFEFECFYDKIKQYVCLFTYSAPDVTWVDAHKRITKENYNYKIYNLAYRIPQQTVNTIKNNRLLKNNLCTIISVC